MEPQGGQSGTSGLGKQKFSVKQLYNTKRQIHVPWKNAWLLPILGALAKSQKATISFFHVSVYPSVCTSDRMENSAPTGRVFMKFDI
jgi:hypothetical protein